MGSRYGRHKRREARRQIESLKTNLIEAGRALASSLQHESEVMAENYNLKVAIDNWDEEIRAVLGTYTALAIKEEALIANPDQIRHFQVTTPISASFINRGMATDEVLAHFQRVYRIIVELEDPEREQLRRRMRFSIMNGDYRVGREACHVFSEALWEDVRNNPRARARFAASIVGDIIRLLAAPPEKEQARV